MENMGNSTKWICLVLACMVSMLEFGLIFSFGAVFVELMNTYRVDRSTAATVQSLLIGVTLSPGVISGVLTKVFGLSKTMFVSSLLTPLGFIVSFFITDIYYIYITIGVIAGLGISLCHVSAVTSVSRAFARNEKQLVLSASIHTTSVTVIGIIYPYFLKWLVKTYGLNGTFLILGGLYSNSFAFFMFLWQQHLPDNSSSAFTYERERITDEDTQLFYPCKEGRNLLKVFKHIISFPFICLLVANGLAIASVNGYLELAFDISAWKGYNESETKELFVILNCFNVFATLTPGLIKQKLKVNTFIFLVISSLSGCVGHILIYSTESYSMYAVASACVGIVPGGIISSSIIFIMETMRQEQISIATGLTFTVLGTLSAGSGPLFGSIRDMTGSYDNVLITISALQAVSALLYLIALCCHRNLINSS